MNTKQRRLLRETTLRRGLLGLSAAALIGAHVEACGGSGSTGTPFTGAAGSSTGAGGASGGTSSGTGGGNTGTAGTTSSGAGVGGQSGTSSGAGGASGSGS